MKKQKINALIPWRSKDGIMIYWLRINKQLKKYLKVNIIKNKFPNSLNPFYFIKLALKAKKCDLLHIQHNYCLFGSLFKKINSIYALLFYSVAKLPVGPKIITTMHDIVEPSRLRFYEKAYLDFMNLPIKLFSTKIIIHKDNSRNQLIRQGFNAEKIVKIPHGVDDLKNIPSSREMRKRFKIPEKKTIILYGWLKKDKQYDKVIDALPYLPDMQLLIIGDTLRIIGDTRDEDHLIFLKNYAKKKGVEDRVIFKHGIPTEKIFEWLSCGDVTVLPYKKISASGALSDSISAHLPVITSDLPEFKEAEKTGVLKVVNVYSKKELANAIQKLINNPTKMKKANLKYVAENNRGVVARKTKELYEEVLKE